MIFNVTGNKLSSKADEALKQANRTEEEVNKVVSYLLELRNVSNSYYNTLYRVWKKYDEEFYKLHQIVEVNGKTEWYDFTATEKQVTENAVLLVGLLYKMCQVKLVIQGSANKVNKVEANQTITDAENIMRRQFN